MSNSKACLDPGRLPGLIMNIDLCMPRSNRRVGDGTNRGHHRNDQCSTAVRTPLRLPFSHSATPATSASASCHLLKPLVGASYCVQGPRATPCSGCASASQQGPDISPRLVSQLQERSSLPRQLHMPMDMTFRILSTVFPHIHSSRDACSLQYCCCCCCPALLPCCPAP